MEVTCLVFSTLALAIAIGSAWYSRSSRQSLGSSTEFSEKLEAFQDQWRSFKRQMMDEWESTDHKLRSIAGRIDRAKREAKKNGQEPLDGDEEVAPGSVDEAAINRAILRARGVNL